jgi:hypothetical protein
MPAPATKARREGNRTLPCSGYGWRRTRRGAWNERIMPALSVRCPADHRCRPPGPEGGSSGRVLCGRWLSRSRPSPGRRVRRGSTTSAPTAAGTDLTGGATPWGKSRPALRSPSSPPPHCRCSASAPAHRGPRSRFGSAPRSSSWSRRCYCWTDRPRSGSRPSLRRCCWVSMLTCECLTVGGVPGRPGSRQLQSLVVSAVMPFVAVGCLLSPPTFLALLDRLAPRTT